MFDWLFEGRLSVYLFLLLVGLVLLVLWWQRRERRLLTALGAVAGAALLCYLLDVLRETDREQVTRKVREMAGAIDRKDFNALFGHVSDDFSSYGMNKKALRLATQLAVERFGVRDARVWELDVVKLDRGAGTATMAFRGAASSNRFDARVAVPCEADFVREKDGQWRVKALRFYRPFVDSLQPWNPFTEP